MCLDSLKGLKRLYFHLFTLVGFNVLWDLEGLECLHSLDSLERSWTA